MIRTCIHYVRGKKIQETYSRQLKLRSISLSKNFILSLKKPLFLCFFTNIFHETFTGTISFPNRLSTIMHQFTSMRGPNRYDVMGALIFCTKVKSSAHERIIMSTFFSCRGKCAIFAIRRSSFRSLFYLLRPSKPGKWALRIFNDGISTNGA